MGELWKFSALFLLAPLMLAAGSTTAMADLQDHCDSGSGPGSYQNLESPSSDYIYWSSPPDGSYLIPSSNRQEASALYECPGGERATIAIYSRHGSFASWDGDRLVRGGGEHPLLYHPAWDEVYCQGQRMVYSTASGEFAFQEEETPSGLVPFGLSVETSTDGQDFFPAAWELRSAWREGPDSYWYEVYDVELEEGVRFLRVLLTDQTSIQIQGRDNRYSFAMSGGLALASVTITGAEEESPDIDIPGEDSEGDPGAYDEDWEDWEDWEDDYWEEEPELPFPSLPIYQPEEESWEDPSWGPDLRWEEDPAFPEELLQPDEPLEEEAGTDSPAPPASSESAPKAAKKPSSPKASSKAGSQKEPENEAPEEEEKVIIPVYLSPPPQSSSNLWRRIVEPDIIGILFISSSLLISAFRILWEQDR